MINVTFELLNVVSAGACIGGEMPKNIKIRKQEKMNQYRSY